MFEVRKIEDQLFPWGIFENGKIIGRFEDHGMAMNVMRGLK